MSPWSCDLESVMQGRGTRHQVTTAGSALRFADALDLLEGSGPFREFLGTTITQSPFVALRWETPPITRETRGRSFEFVLVDDPWLVAAPEPDVFAPYFDAQPPDVLALAVPNLGRTATLVVPRALGRPAVYAHLKAFLHGAPEPQVHQLWQCVARTARQGLSERPLWVSTAGGGVSWLHVRLECRAKYYAYRPYAQAT